MSTGFFHINEMCRIYHAVVIVPSSLVVIARYYNTMDKSIHFGTRINKIMSYNRMNFIGEKTKKIISS